MKVQNSNPSPLRRLSGDTVIAASTTLLAKCAGFVKEIFVAASFGLSGEVDIYLVAMVLIGFPMSILLNATQSAMIAKMAAIQERDPSVIMAIFLQVLLVTLGVLTVVLLLWLLAMPILQPKVASGFAPPKQEQLHTAIWLLIPYYFLSGINLLGYGYLQVRRKFLINGLVPILTPIVTILAIGVGQEQFPPLSLLLAAIVLGSLLETLMLVKLILASNKQIEKKQELINSSTRQIAASSLKLLPGSAIMALGPLIDQSLAATLVEGSNAALAYGNKLPAAIQSVLVSAVAMTVLPFFSSQLAQQNYKYCFDTLRRLSAILLAGGTLFVIPMILFSQQIVRLIYERGEFGIEAVTTVFPIQSIYLIQIPFALVSILCMKAIVAHDKHLLISISTAIALILQTSLGYWLKSDFGVLGIALATVITNCTLGILYFVLATNGIRKSTINGIY